MGSVVVVPVFGCSMVCEIFLDQGLNLCPLHWQANSYPLHHQASPDKGFLVCFFLQETFDLSCFSGEAEKAMAAHSSILVWRIPGTEEPGGLLSMGSHRVGHN